MTDELLADRIDALVEQAPRMSAKAFAYKALPLLVDVRIAMSNAEFSSAPARALPVSVSNQGLGEG